MQLKHLVKILILILFSVALCSPVTGSALKDFNPDSLDRVISQTEEVDKKIDLLIEITHYYTFKDVNRAQAYAEQLMEFSQEEEHNKGLSYAYYFLANVMGEFDYALVEEYVSKSMEIAKETDDKVLEAKLYNSIGGLKHESGLYDEEIEYYFKAIDLYEESGSDSLIAAIYNNLGIAYSIKGDPALANEYFRQAAEINTRFSNWPWLSINLLNIGFEYLEAGDTEKALEYLQRSLDIAKKYDYKRLYAWICNNLGITYLKKGEENKAKEYFLLGLENARKMNNREQEIQSLTHLKDLYKAEGDFENAYHLLVDIKQKNDSLQNMQSKGAIDILETAFIYQKKLEQEALKHQNQTLVYWIIIIILLFLIGIVVALNYYQRLKAKTNLAISEKLQVEKDFLEQEVGTKSRELISKVMHLNSTNELVNEVVNKLSSSELQFKEENTKPMNEIIASLKMNRKTNILEGFDTEFKSVHPSFQERLSKEFPDLTSNEKRLCAFLKLNLNTKEISEITHLEMSSVEKARTRLRKKLNLTGSDKNLAQFLQDY